MKKYKLSAILIPALLIPCLLGLTACSSGNQAVPASSPAADSQVAGNQATADSQSTTGSSSTSGNETISGAEAKQLMDTESDYIILDVRRQDEYDAGHIPGAILLPYDEIRDRADSELPDKDQLILVYCRSGNRSGQASATLADLGYTNIKDFGGILDWEYETTTE